MKKKLMLSLLSLFTLVACGGKTSETSQSSSSESSSTVGETSSSESSSSSSSSVEEKDWTEEQKKTMSDNLYGVVLPYIDVGETVVEYDDEYGEVLVLGSSTVNQTTLKDYATLLTSNGWYDASDQYTGLPEDGTVYVYEKEVSTKQGEKLVDVQYWALDTETYEPTQEGLFFLVAKDPYFGMYDFPSEDFDYITGNYYESEVTVPAFEADLYMPVTDYDDNFVGTICLTSSQNAEETYKSTLQQSSYTILEEKSTTNLNNKDYDVNCAVSSDKKFAVMYAYIEDFGGLYIYVDDVPLSVLATDTWPSKGLQKAFQAYEQTAFDVPELKFDGAKYYGHENSGNALFVEYGMTDYVSYIIEVLNATEDNYNTYVGTTLKEAGWTEVVLEGQAVVEETTIFKEFTKEFDGKIATIDVDRDSETGVVSIYVYLYMQDTPEAEPTGWPTEGLNTAFSTYEQTPFEVPEMTSETSTLTYSGEESSMNSIYKNQGATAKIKYVITVTGSSTEDFNKYVETTLPTTGWTLDQAKTEEIADGTKVFTKTTDGHTARLDVSPGVGQTTIFVYLYPQEAAQSN